MFKKKFTFTPIVCSALWLAAVAGGLWSFNTYVSAPGVGATTEVVWPRATSLTRSQSRPTLLLFAHPQCPCTRATLEELAIFMTRCPDQVTVRVLFFRPRQRSQQFPEHWEKTDLWASAARLRGVQVQTDEDGVEARRFGVQTSGQVLLYNASSELLFSGGITAARGHMGDNQGLSTLISLVRENSDGRVLRSHARGVAETPVFGCSLTSTTQNRVVRAQSSTQTPVPTVPRCAQCAPLPKPNNTAARKTAFSGKAAL